MTVAPVTAPAGVAGAGLPRPAAAAPTDAAASFERLLLEQLTKGLTATAAPEDASPATAAYRDMLPATMADALSQAGGIGLAARVTEAATGVPAAPGATPGVPAAPGAPATSGTATGVPAGTTSRTTSGSPA